MKGVYEIDKTKSEMIKDVILEILKQAGNSWPTFNPEHLQETKYQFQYHNQLFIYSDKDSDLFILFSENKEYVEVRINPKGKRKLCFTFPYPENDLEFLSDIKRCVATMKRIYKDSEK